MQDPSNPIAAENAAASAAFDGTQRFTTSDVGRPAAQGSSPFFLFRLPWTMAMMAVGMATIAACVLLPLREENRQLAHAYDGVEAEAQFTRRQIDVNAAFLQKLNTDPALAERLVLRATRTPGAGKQILGEESVGNFGSSPYAITQLTPPAPPPPYRSDLHPVLASVLSDTRSRVILMAAGLFLVGAAVILGPRRGESASSTSR